MCSAPDSRPKPLISSPPNGIAGLFLWAEDNPIHDLEAARAAAARLPGVRSTS